MRPPKQNKPWETRGDPAGRANSPGAHAPTGTHRSRATPAPGALGHHHVLAAAVHTHAYLVVRVVQEGIWAASQSHGFLLRATFTAPQHLQQRQTVRARPEHEFAAHHLTASDPSQRAAPGHGSGRGAPGQDICSRGPAFPDTRAGSRAPGEASVWSRACEAVTEARGMLAHGSGHLLVP